MTCRFDETKQHAGCDDNLHCEGCLLDEIDELRPKLKALELRWTKEMPTKEGWYWLRRPWLIPTDKLVKVEQSRTGAYWGYWDHGGNFYECSWDRLLWAGPIPEPLPQETEQLK